MLSAVLEGSEVRHGFVLVRLVHGCFGLHTNISFPGYPGVPGDLLETRVPRFI